MTNTSTRMHVNGGFVVLSIAISLGLAFIPAAIASGKGRSFGLFYLFGLFCFLPALIVSLVISDERSRNGPFGAGGYPGGYGSWNPQPGGWVPPGSAPQWGASTPPPPPPPGAQPPPPPSPPAGWYPDPGGTAQQRYWDGTRWTDQLH